MKVIDLINNIKKEREKSKSHYITKCSKDESQVMKAILNDQEYSVDLYDNSGKYNTYNPSKEFRGMISNIISNTTNISSEESSNLMNNYSFTEKEANTMIDFSKEFVNTYLQTGRKLSFGGREKSEISIYKKTIEEHDISFPVLKNGKVIDTRTSTIPEYDTIKVDKGYPSWLNNK